MLSTGLVVFVYNRKRKKTEKYVCQKVSLKCVFTEEYKTEIYAAYCGWQRVKFV